MNSETQEEQEQSLRGWVWVSLCWLAGIVVLYVLSTGPVIMMYFKGLLPPRQPHEAGR